MRLPLLLAGITGLVIANPLKLPTDFNRYAPRQPGINWEECPRPIDKSLRCGRFEVPMDYHNASAGKASLAVIQYPATKQPRLGTLFLNPGGPGASGIEFVSGGFKTTISNAAGGQYDLVSWDPRGVGDTYPRIDCFDDAQQENDFWEGTIPRAGLEARGNFTERADREAFYKQSSDVDRLLHALGDRCLTYNGDTLKYVGTAATVRDMIGLHEYLEQNKGPINFWGFSYGTMVGSFFVNMFPDRVGRVVLDGVVDPEYYASRLPYKRWAIQASSSDDAFEGFVKTCSAAGHAKCAFAQDGSSPFSLKERVRALLDDAYDYKKKTGSWLGSSFLRNKIFHAMYGPSLWPRLAHELDAYESFFKTRNANDRSRCIERQPPKAMLKGDPPPDYSFQAISCGDAVDMPGVTIDMVFDELVKVTNQVSHMFGPSWGSAGFYCHQWPVRAAERYSGPWNSTLSNRILVIGNEADPVTPLKSAKNVAAALKDSAVLVEQDDWGHTSLAMHSDCTIDVLKNYFVNNTKPTSGKICGTDRKIFGDMTRSMLLSAYQSPSSGDILSKAENSSPTPQTLFNWTSLAMVSLACAVGFCIALLVQAAKRRWGNSARGVNSDAKFLDTKQYKAEFRLRNHGVPGRHLEVRQLRLVSRGLHALNTVAEDGPATPSHGGTFTAGHEYDMTIHPTEEKPANAATANLPDTTDTPPAPAPAEAPPTASPAKLGVPRAINPAAIAARRPVSMPPQSSNSPAVAVVGGERMSIDENREREKEARRDRRAVHAPSSSLHLQNVQDHNPPRPLLRGLRNGPLTGPSVKPVWRSSTLSHLLSKFQERFEHPYGEHGTPGFGLANLFNPEDHLSTFCESQDAPVLRDPSAVIHACPQLNVWRYTFSGTRP